MTLFERDVDCDFGYCIDGDRSEEVGRIESDQLVVVKGDEQRAQSSIGTEFNVDQIHHGEQAGDGELCLLSSLQGAGRRKEAQCPRSSRDFRPYRNAKCRELSKSSMNCLQMRQFDHDNVNKFIGLSIDGPLYLSIWKYCSRGSLQARSNA